jgi:hypothetical protein
MPERTSSTVIWGRAQLESLLGDWLALPMAPPLASVNLHLMGAAGFVPTPDTLEADLEAVECGAAWYSVEVVTPAGVVTVSPPGGAILASQLYIATDPSPDPFVPDTITGWWLSNGPGMVAGGPLTPVPIAAPGDWLLLNVLLPVPFSVHGIG